MVAAHEMGLKNSVTFHHFTTPMWAAEQGGWANPQIVEWFTDYVAMATAFLGDLIDIAATFNEPNVVALAGYHGGDFPPGHKGDWDSATAATDQLRRGASRGVSASSKTAPATSLLGSRSRSSTS